MLTAASVDGAIKFPTPIGVASRCLPGKLKVAVAISEELAKYKQTCKNRLSIVSTELAGMIINYLLQLFYCRI